MTTNKKAGRKGQSVFVGDRFLGNTGDWCAVKKYENYSKITICYDNNPEKDYVVNGGNLKKGAFLNPDSLHYKIGSRHKSKDGEFCTVISYRNSKDISVVFDGYENYVKKVFTGSLKSGDFKNDYRPNVCGVGFIGVGEYCATGEFGITTAYLTWSNMLMRCYDEKNFVKQATYKNCTVCEGWMNFQVFAKWYYEHESYGLRYELDKDLLFVGNKTYSPETCTMLPKELNILLNNERVNRGISLGVTKRESGKSFRAVVGKEGRRVHIGDFKTPEEARDAYVEAKERYVKNKALEWTNRIEWRAFVSLMNWEVYPKEVI